MNVGGSLILALASIVTIPCIAEESLEDYAKECDALIGVTVPAFDCKNGTEVPDTHPNGEACDRPQQLRQICDPGSMFQVLVNTRKAIVVAHCRKGHRAEGKYNDIAIIQYSPTNGATCFYQALASDGSISRITQVEKGMGYRNGVKYALTITGGEGENGAAHALGQPDGTLGNAIITNVGSGYTSPPDVAADPPPSGRVATYTSQIKPRTSLVGSAKAPSEGTALWAPGEEDSHWMMPATTAGEHCGGCHDNGPIIRSPYLAQLTGKDKLPGAGDESFNSNEPYCFVGEDFADWKAYKVVVEGNSCNECHRMGVNNVTEGGTSMDFGIRATAEFPLNKNPPSADSPMWMPPDTIAYSKEDADAALAIRDCAKQFHESESLPDSPACKVTQFTSSSNFDPCLVGKWEATSATYNPTYTSGGGTGFKVSFHCDGTETVDYTDMKPMTGGADTLSYSGKATARLSTKDKIATIEAFVKSTAQATLKTPVSPNNPVVWEFKDRLGPGGLGGTTDDNSYVCDKETLTYKGSMHQDQHANFGVTLTRLKN